MFSSLISRLADYFSHQEEARLMWPPVFLGLGATLYFALLFEPSYMAIGGGVALCASLFFGLRRLYHYHSGAEGYYLLYLLGAALLLVAVGFGVSQLRSYSVGTPVITKETRPVHLTAKIESMEDRGGRQGWIVLLSDVRIDKWTEEKTPRRLRLTVRTKIAPSVCAGDRIEMLAKLTPPAPPVMPGAFDYARHFYFQGIGGLGFSLSAVTPVEKVGSKSFDLGYLRSIVSTKIKEQVVGPSQGIVVALMTGERASISDDDWQALRASGLAHIISISGLHVAMVAAPVFFLVRLLLAFVPAIALRFDVKKVAAVVALVACSLYVGFVVPSVPTTRSLLMTGVGLLAIMYDRSPFSLRLVGVSAILILLVAPESIWSASFQMSFAAVAALVASANWMRPVWLRLYSEVGIVRKGLLFLAGSVIASFVASVATAPFVWYHFQQMASYSVLGNFLAMPLSGLIIMPMMILSYLLMPFGLAGPSLNLMAMGVDWLLDVARIVQGLPGALVTGHISSPAFLYLVTVGGLVLVLFSRWWKIVSGLFFVLAMVALFVAKLPVVLVAPEGDLVLVRDGDVGYVSTKSKERFVRNQWETRLGLSDVKSFPKEGYVDFKSGGQMSCDREACRIEVGGIKLVYGGVYTALIDDCLWGDVLVTPLWMSRTFCRDKIVYDARELWRSGAVEIFSDGARVSTSELRGHRPWVGNIRHYRKD